MMPSDQFLSNDTKEYMKIINEQQAELDRLRASVEFLQECLAATTEKKLKAEADFARWQSEVKKLQEDIYSYELDNEYEMWEGCYNDTEYDFKARETLKKRYPELDWRNPEHEEMLIDMALESHAIRWRPEFLEGGWTRETFIFDGLRDLFCCYDVNYHPREIMEKVDQKK